MSEYVFRYAPGFGFDMDDQMETLPLTAREYYASNRADHYGTLHEEIVRCRDCKHYHKHKWFDIVPGTPLGSDISDVCMFFGGGVKVEPGGFCKWGERREQ